MFEWPQSFMTLVIKMIESLIDYNY